MRTLHAILVTGFVAGLLAEPGVAATVPYTFVNIADTSGPLPLDGAPSGIALNSSGTVAFFAQLDESTMFTQGIFTGSGGPITTLYDTRGPFGVFIGAPSLNDLGTVAFSALLDAGGSGIFTGSGGPTTTIADTSGPFSDVGSPALNDLLTVAFSALLDAGGSGIFTGSGGPTTTIADTSGPFSDVGSPALNDLLTVAFLASLDAGGSGIFTGSGGPTTTIADTNGPFSDFGFLPALNDLGTVAFSALLDAGGSGIFTDSGGPTTTIVDTNGPFSDVFGDPFNLGLFGGPSLNDLGTVAFFAQLDTPEFGIFTGPDPSLDAVVRLGDPLFGSTVVEFRLDLALNNAGQVAFTYLLADGRIGVARADPFVAVPVPASLGLVAAGVIGVAMAQWASRQSRVRRPAGRACQRGSHGP
jgi:hypothetical protein